MNTSAFGVEHEVSKGEASETAGAALKAAHAAGDHAKQASRYCPTCNGGWTHAGKPKGPGSMRAKMSQSAWESQTASHTRRQA